MACERWSHTDQLAAGCVEAIERAGTGVEAWWPKRG
jgi:hypothetical protein